MYVYCLFKRTRSTYNDVAGMLIYMWCFNRCRCMLEHILKRTRSKYRYCGYVYGVVQQYINVYWTSFLRVQGYNMLCCYCYYI